MSDEQQRAAQAKIEEAIARAFGHCYDAHRAAQRDGLAVTAAHLSDALAILELAHTALLKSD